MKGFSFVLLSFLLFSCQPMSRGTIDELKEVDSQFSAKATKIGFNKAFIEFAHDDAVLLRENSMPQVGKPTLKKIFENSSADGIDFTWEPLAGDIAKSGELGFTYGIYTLKKDTLVEKGTYVSIWKKDTEGNWKYILDCGNKGIGD